MDAFTNIQSTCTNTQIRNSYLRAGLLPAKLTTVVRFSTKGGLRELLLDRAKAHHGATPIKAHLGGGDCKEVSPSSTTQGRLYSGPPVARAVQCTATHDRPMRRRLLGGRLARAQQSPQSVRSRPRRPPAS